MRIIIVDELVKEQLFGCMELKHGFLFIRKEGDGGGGGGSEGSEGSAGGSGGGNGGKSTTGMLLACLAAEEGKEKAPVDPCMIGTMEKWARFLKHKCIHYDPQAVPPPALSLASIAPGQGQGEAQGDAQGGVQGGARGGVRGDGQQGGVGGAAKKGGRFFIHLAPHRTLSHPGLGGIATLRMSEFMTLVQESNRRRGEKTKGQTGTVRVRGRLVATCVLGREGVWECV